MSKKHEELAAKAARIYLQAKNREQLNVAAHYIMLASRKAAKGYVGQKAFTEKVRTLISKERVSNHG